MGLVIDKIKGPLLHNHKGLNVIAQKAGQSPGALFVNLGYLYNWYAGTNIKNISNTGWHNLSVADMVGLRLYLDPVGTYNNNTSGGQMKSVGSTYWDAPNIGASNSSKLDFRGSGSRDASGNFSLMNLTCWIWNTEDWGTIEGGIGTLQYNLESFTCLSANITNKNIGAAVRLKRDVPTALPDGSIITNGYTGNDGRLYDTVVINGYEYLGYNLMESKYQDGSDIPEITSNVLWASNTTGARCSYNNDQSLSGTYESKSKSLGEGDSIIFKEGNNIQLSLENNVLTIAETAPSDIAGNAATATKFHTSRNVNSVAFDGSSDITIPESQQTLNLVTAYSVAY